MDRQSLAALRTPDGQAALAAAEAFEPREKDFLRHLQTLQRRYPVMLARAALETAILRREAAAKFPYASRLYFTRDALEQASGDAIARHRAARYQEMPHILDLACSIGSDTIALAQAAPVTGCDLDPLRLALAQANAQARAELLPPLHPVRFARLDLTQRLPFRLDHRTGLFFDPARRSAGKRAFSIHEYQPPLTVIDDWFGQAPALGVKISPGVQMEELQGYTKHCEVEFLSVGGELKEAVLWFGPLRAAARRATLLPGGQTLRSHVPFPDWAARSEHPIAISPPQRYLYEPDAAIIRAGLVEDLAAQIDAQQLDPDIAYLTASTPVDTPFARRWEVLDWFPFQLKHLRAELRARRVGRVTVKKRGSPITPEDLIRQLRLEGEEERVLFLTHQAGKPIVILANETGAV